MAGRTPPELRVALLSETACGGVWRHWQHLVPALAGRGVHLDLIVSDTRIEPDFAGTLAAWRALGCRTLVCGMPHRLRLLADRRLAAAVAAQLASWGSTLLHSHSTKAGFLGAMAAGRAGIPLVHSPHGFYFARFPATSLRRRLALGFERWLAGRLHSYVCVSAAERELALHERLLPDHRLKLAANGMPADFAAGLLSRDAARTALGIIDEADAPGGVLHAVCNGRLCPQKGQDLLLEAWSRLPPETAGRLRLHLLGDGPAAATLRRATARLGLAEKIVWHGFIPAAWRFLKAFDLALLPSRHEGLAYALLEALAAGLPLVAADIPGNLPDPAIRHAAAFHPPADADGLAAAISRLAVDADERRRLSLAGPPLVQGKFTLERQAAALLDAYCSAVP